MFATHTHTFAHLHTSRNRQQDYASPETRAVAQEVIARESQKMSPHVHRAYEKKRKQLVEEGKRDLYF